ncbi:MAG: Glycine reductase complex component B subunit gamma [Firmicutes bacterium]|nr:Glycine reductase complex component B subunit gamma [Bacillota bacterium]
MSNQKLKVVHYLNQFYGGIGGEDKAGHLPEERAGALGPGQALQAALGTDAEIVATVICGDDYFAENLDGALHTVITMIKAHAPDLVVTGPAFNAGRYGVACGAVAKAVFEELHVPVVSGMYHENPGVEMYRRYAYVVKTGNSAADMRKAIPAIANLVKALGKREEVTPETHAYIPQGLRKNYFHAERGAKRAVDMLVAKINAQPFVTEYPMPHFDRVAPNMPIADASKAKIALVTSGGIVPKGNPDHIESSSASRYGKYDIQGVSDLTPEKYATAHGGYDPVYANLDSDRVLPVDVLREMEQAGEIGVLHRYFYTTVGNGTSVANCAAFAKKFVQELVNDGVQAVILTST